MKLGICLPVKPGQTESLKKIKAQGAEYLETGFFQLAQLSAEEISRLVAETREIGLPLTHANSLFGGMPLLASPEDLIKAKEYLERSFALLSNSDLRHITFGSGKSRSVPEGQSHQEATERLTAFCKETLAPLARQYSFTVGIEPLNHSETNLLTTAREAFQLVKAVDDPAIRLLVDYYHFTVERENPAELTDYRGYISHLHIASTKSGRIAPLPENLEGAEYIAFLEFAKQAAGTDVTLSIEGGIPEPCDETLPRSFAYLRKLISEIL